MTPIRAYMPLQCAPGGLTQPGEMHRIVPGQAVWNGWTQAEEVQIASRSSLSYSFQEESVSETKKARLSTTTSGRARIRKSTSKQP